MFLSHLFFASFFPLSEKELSRQQGPLPCCPGNRLFKKRADGNWRVRPPISQSAYATGGCRGGAKTKGKTSTTNRPTRNAGEKRRQTERGKQKHRATRNGGERGERRGGEKVDKMRVSSSGTKASERNIRRQRSKRPPAPPFAVALAATLRTQ